MIDDAAKEGYSLIICSSYRDYEGKNELQKRIYFTVYGQGAFLS